jgi:hypothetical protein
MKQAISRQRRQRIAWLALALCAAVAGRCPGQQSLLLEGFEDISAVWSQKGDLAPVRAEGAVTQGQAAARFPPGTRIILKVPAAQLKANAWLSIDTLTTQPLTQPIDITFRLPGRSARCTGYVQPGRDTLALPLSQALVHATQPLPEGDIALIVANAGDAPLIMDNIRLEPAATPPPGSVLLDFGPDRQIVWPGFEAAAASCPQLRWSGQGVIYAYAPGAPDPLGGDYVGRYPVSKVTDWFQLRTPSEQGGVAWIWATHYASPAFSQPLEYALKCRGRALLHKRLSRREALGPEGLLEGMGGQWTPQWYDRQYAPHLVAEVEVDLAAGANRVDVGNCQIAAIAIAPASQREQMSAYVDRVREDLRRYRRQFVAAVRREGICDLEPTADERKAGMMVFLPPADEAFAATWKPTPQHRAQRLHVLAANGTSAALALAVVPIREVSFLSGSVGPLRSRQGLPLRAPTGGLAAQAVERVPRLVNGQITFQPWVLKRRHGPLKEREIAFLAVHVRTSPSARAGTYSGKLRLSSPGAAHDVPIEVEVAHIGTPEVEMPTVGLTFRPEIGLAYGVLAGEMAPASRRAYTGRLRRQLLSGQFNAFSLRGAALASGTKADATRLADDLKMYPLNLVSGRTLVDVTQTFHELDLRQTPSRSELYRRAVRAVVAETNEVAAKANLTGYYHYVGRAVSEPGLDRASARAATVGDAGGRPAVLTRASRLRAMAAASDKGAFAPFAALILETDASDLPQRVEAFRKLGGRREVFVYTFRGDRYRVGFYAAACGAEGVYVGRLFTRASPYRGHHFNGAGLLVVRPDGTFAETLGMLSLRQGIDEYLLFKRAEALVATGDAAKVQTLELSAALSEIRTAAAKQRVAYDAGPLRTTALTPEQIDALRARLIHAAAAVAGRLKP